MAVVAYTVLVTGCSGALIALLNYAGQAKAIVSDAKGPLMLSVTFFGAALGLTAWSALLGYLTEFRFANGQEMDRLWWAALLTAFAALLAFTAGLIASGVMLARQLA